MFDRMIDRVSRGWRLTKTAFRVLMSNKKLLLFPMLSLYGLALVLASFILPLILSDGFRDVLNNQNGQNLNQVASNVVYFLILFAFYFCNYFVIVFFNSALVACVLMHFNGEEPTVGDGFRAALGCLPQIFMWALVSATVGVLLRIIAERSGKLGQIIASLMGVAWGIMTYFVVPVLVVEKVGPFEAIRRSCRVMKKTWGESITANFGIGLILFFLNIAALLPLIICLLIGGVVAIIIGLTITVSLWLLLALVSSALNTIVIAALYQYAAENSVPKPFKEGSLVRAFGRE